MFVPHGAQYSCIDAEYPDPPPCDVNARFAFQSINTLDRSSLAVLTGVLRCLSFGVSMPKVFPGLLSPPLPGSKPISNELDMSAGCLDILPLSP